MYRIGRCLRDSALLPEGVAATLRAARDLFSSSPDRVRRS